MAAVELGRTWCVRHRHLRFARIFRAAAAEQQSSIGMSVRGGRRHHKPNHGTVYLRLQEAGFDDEGGGRESVRERGRDGLNSPRARISVFQIRTASARSILVLEWRRGGTDWKGVATRTRAKERADWAKAMR